MRETSFLYFINTWISIVKVRALNLTKKTHSQS
jgi:hypothetical protein